MPNSRPQYGWEDRNEFCITWPQLVDAAIVVDIAPNVRVHHEAYIAAMKGVDFTVAKSRKDIEALLSQTLASPGIIQFFMKNSTGNQRGAGMAVRSRCVGKSVEQCWRTLEYGYFDGPPYSLQGDRAATLPQMTEKIYEHFPNMNYRPLRVLVIGCTQRLERHLLIASLISWTNFKDPSPTLG